MKKYKGNHVVRQRKLRRMRASTNVSLRLAGIRDSWNGMTLPASAESISNLPH